MLSALCDGSPIDVTGALPSETEVRLRRGGKEGALRCKLCRGAVLFRKGPIVRAHFAHRPGAKCAWKSDSADVLDARAALFRWLGGKFGDRAVLEHHVPDAGLARPIDCWVEAAGETRPSAYLLIAKRPRPEERDRILELRNAAQVHVLFLAREGWEPGRDVSVALDATERALISEPLRGRPTGPSLHYLLRAGKGAEAWKMVTLRRLMPLGGTHFRGDAFETPLTDMLVLKTGAFVHPSEKSDVTAHRSRGSARADRAATSTTAARAAIARPSRQRPTAPSTAAATGRLQGGFWNRSGATADVLPGSETRPSTPDRHSGAAPGSIGDAPGRQPAAAGRQPEEATCLLCGARTRDWYYFDPCTRSCKCNECLRTGRAG